MVEELKLAIKVDDDAIEQSLLKQFANAEKMANKVVLTFNNIDLDDKAIEAKFKEMQKIAGKNPIDLSIDKSSIEMLSAISKQLGNIFDIAKGKSIIDSSATISEIKKTVNALSLLEKASKMRNNGEITDYDSNDYNFSRKMLDNRRKEVEELQKQLNKFSGDKANSEFKSLQENLENLKVEFLALYSCIEDSFPDKINLTNGQGVNKRVKNLYSSIIQEELKETQKQAEQTSKALSKIAYGNKSNISSGSPTQNFDNSIQQDIVMLENYKNTIKEIDALKLEPETEETKAKIEELNKLADYFVSKISVIRSENGGYVSQSMMKFSGQWNEILKKYPDNARNELYKLASEKSGLQIGSVSTEFAGIEKEISNIESKSETLRLSLTQSMQDSIKYVKELKYAFTTLAASQDELKTEKNPKWIEGFNSDINKALSKFPELIQFKDKFTEDQALQFVKTDEWNKFLSTLPQAQEYLKSIGYSFEEIKESSTSPIKDVSQGDKIDQVTTSAKELDNTLEQVNIPTDSFDEVLSKLDLAKSELGEIVKITKQSVSDSEGKFHDSYTLKDKRGSTEIYGLSSNTEKGQLLRSNIVGYDAKAEAQESKRIIEENIRLNKAYYDSKKQEEAEYQRLRAKYLAEGKAQEEKYYADLKKSRESTLKSYQSEIDSYRNKVANFEVKPDEGHSYDTWKNQIKELNSEIDKYQAKVNEVNNNGGIVDEKDKQEIKEIQENLEKMVRTMSKTSAGERGWTDIGASKTAEKIYSILEKNTKMSKSARDQIKAYYNEVRSGNPSAPLNEILDKCIKIEQKEREMGRAGKSWLDIFKDKKIYSFLGQAASMFSFYDLIRYGREGIDTIREFDDGLTKISYTMDITKSQLNDLGKSVLDMANDLDSSINNAMQVSQIYANMNTSAEEIKKLSEPTLILSNLTGFDASTVADDIQAVTQQFNIAAEDSMHIADVYDQISRNISVDYSKILELILETI